MTRRPNAPLGYTQITVLRLLASEPKSVQHLAYDWPSLTEDAARASIHRLARRGLVDVAGWDDYNRRTYCLTRDGAETERALNQEEAD